MQRGVRCRRVVQAQMDIGEDELSPNMFETASEGASTEHRLLDVVEGTLRDLHGEARIALRVTLDSSLDRDLGLDSLSRMELLLRTEGAFGVDLPDDTLARVESVRDLYDALLRARPGGAPAPPRMGPTLTSGAVRQAETPVEATTLLQVLDWHTHAHPEQIEIIHLADGDRNRDVKREREEVVPLFLP